jgi:virginiamycin A acetyltransferase
LPAKVIRYRFNENIIEQLLKLEWWRFNFVDFNDLDHQNVESFINGLLNKIHTKKINEMDLKFFNLSESLSEFLTIKKIA